MAAFNYRDLIRQVPGHTWRCYFQARRINLLTDQDWNEPQDILAALLIEAVEALPDDTRQMLFQELRQVHGLASRRGIDALRNAATPGAVLHDDFPKLTCDAERALWVMAHSPELVPAAEAICGIDRMAGRRGWKRLFVGCTDTLFREPTDLRALEQDLAAAFSPRKGPPRFCEVDCLDRHLDGGLQLSIRIEDSAQQLLAFGDDNRTHWREVRPHRPMDVVIYPHGGLIDLLVPGGAEAHRKVLGQVGKHVFRKALQPQPIGQPVFHLNRLRSGLNAEGDAARLLANHRVERIRLSQVKVRAVRSPICDYIIKPPGDKYAPDVLACAKAHGVDQRLLNQGFCIQEAVVSLYFLSAQFGKAGRIVHAELKSSGISNHAELDEADLKLVEALLQAWGVTPHARIETEHPSEHPA